MKLEDLSETPQYVDKELDKKFEIRGVFVSDDTLKVDYDQLYDRDDPDIGKIEAFIKKSKSAAIIGLRQKRESDGKNGVRPHCIVEFKNKVNLNGIKHIPGSQNDLQVSIVTTSENSRRSGFGMLLYLALAKNGFTVVSDNTQYIGGKALWKTLASNMIGSKYKVFVLENGELMMDGDKPIVYDGSNIDEALLWSESVDKKYVLFALKKM